MSLSGFRPACSMYERGIRWPDVDDTEPNAKFLPLRSAKLLMPLPALVMKTDFNCSSSTRWTSGIVPPLVRW